MGTIVVRGCRFRSWAVTFVGGWSSSPSFMGVRLRSSVVVPFVWCCGGRLVHLWVVIIAGGRIHSVVPLVGCSGGLVGCGGAGKLVGCGGGELVGCGSRPLVCGGGRSLWLFVVVYSCVVSLLWFRRGSRWYV